MLGMCIHLAYILSYHSNYTERYSYCFLVTTSLWCCVAPFARPPVTNLENVINPNQKDQWGASTSTRQPKGSQSKRFAKLIITAIHFSFYIFLGRNKHIYSVKIRKLNKTAPVTFSLKNTQLHKMQYNTHILH